MIVHVDLVAQAYCRVDETISSERREDTYPQSRRVTFLSLVNTKSLRSRAWLKRWTPPQEGVFVNLKAFVECQMRRGKAGIQGLEVEGCS